MHPQRAWRSRIAVIDDDPTFLELMHDLLEAGEGYDVRTSADWIGSFEFVQREQPDLLILDLMMGREQTGWAVLDLLRSDPNTRHVPVILCSAAAPALGEVKQRVRLPTGLRVVPKPFDVDTLLETIEGLLTPEPVERALRAR